MSTNLDDNEATDELEEEEIRPRLVIGTYKVSRMQNSSPGTSPSVLASPTTSSSSSPTSNKGPTQQQLGFSLASIPPVPSAPSPTRPTPVVFAPPSTPLSIQEQRRQEILRRIVRGQSCIRG